MKRFTILYFLIILITHTTMVMGDQRQEEYPTSVVFKYGEGVTVSASTNKLGYLDGLSLSTETKVFKIAPKHLKDIAAPELRSIVLTPIFDKGELQSYDIAITFNRRFYVWGESTSEVVFVIDGGKLVSKRISKPVAKGENEVFEVFPEPGK